MKKKLLTITLTSALLLSNTSLILAETKATKDETIYISLEEDGSVKHADASIHLSSEQAIKNIEDRSNLDDIQNIKSEIQPELKNGKIKWNTDEKDIYYTGKVTKKTPVTFSIDYKLNGKTIKLEDALGKDGQFEMQIKAQNNHRKNITLNGKQQNLFVPYAVLGLIPFDKDIFKNIDADHAKVISDGNKEMIAFVTLPGMKQNFDVKDIDEKIHIKADVKDLSMNPIYLTAVPLEIDLDDEEIDLSTIEDLKASLLEGLTELKDGTQALYEGNETFNEGVHQLELGTVSAKEGAQQLELGASALEEALQQAQTGSNALANGSKQVAAGNTELAERFNTVMRSINGNGSNLASDALGNKIKGFNDNISKLVDGTKAINEGVIRTEKGAMLLNGGVLQLIENIEDNKVKITKMMAEIGVVLDKKEKDIENLKQKQLQLESMYHILNQSEARFNENDEKVQFVQVVQIIDALPKDEQSLIRGTMNSLIEGNLALIVEMITTFEAIQSQYELAQVTLNSLDNPETIQQIEALKTGSGKLLEGLEDLSKGSDDLLKGMQQLQIVTNQMNEKLNQTLLSTPTLMNEINSLAKGSQDLASGNQGLNAGISEIAGKAPELQAGTAALNSGLNELNTGASALSEGSDQLLAGSKTLYEAVAEVDVNEQQFDELLEYKDELEALMDNNDSFTGKNDTIESKVKFIYKTNKLEKEEEVIEHVEEENEEKGFFNWLKNLFK